MTPRERLLAHFRLGPADRIGASLYEFCHLDAARPHSGGYEVLNDLQRRMGECFLHASADIGTAFANANVVSEGSADLGQGGTRRCTLATPKGDLVSVHRRDGGNITWWQIKPFIESADDCRKWLSIPEPQPTFDVSEILAAQAKVGDVGVVLFGPGDALGIVCGYFHFDKFVEILMDDEGLILEMLRVVNRRLLRGVTEVAGKVKNVCFRFWGPEYAGAPLLNPRTHFHRLVTEFLRPVVRAVNESGNISIVHCHGFLAELLDEFAEIGPMVLEPLEVLPSQTANVTMEQVKSRLGGRMCLMGAIESSEIELMARPAFERRARTVVETMAPGGGFVLLPTGAPIEYPVRSQVIDNYRAFFEAADKYGRY